MLVIRLAADGDEEINPLSAVDLRKISPLMLCPKSPASTMKIELAANSQAEHNHASLSTDMTGVHTGKMNDDSCCHSLVHIPMLQVCCPLLIL